MTGIEDRESWTAIEHLVRLFQEIALERLVVLFGVPGAAARRAQLAHDIHEELEAPLLGLVFHDYLLKA